jgi:hypothetical protein
MSEDYPQGRWYPSKIPEWPGLFVPRFQFPALRSRILIYTTAENLVAINRSS